MLDPMPADVFFDLVLRNCLHPDSSLASHTLEPVGDRPSNMPPQEGSVALYITILVLTAVGTYGNFGIRVDRVEGAPYVRRFRFVYNLLLERLIHVCVGTHSYK